MIFALVASHCLLLLPEQVCPQTDVWGRRRYYVLAGPADVFAPLLGWYLCWGAVRSVLGLKTPPDAIRVNDQHA